MPTDVERLSLPQARRVALAAQGFTDPAPAGRPDVRHVRRVLGRTHLLQLDSVNVFERAHLLPLFSRLGPYDKDLLARSAYGPRRELFEYWGHEASLLPLGLHPLLRWRMARIEALQDGWGEPLRVMREHPEFVALVLRHLEQGGPMTAAQVQESVGHDRGRPAGPWWDWSLPKAALEYLFGAGRVTTADRAGFTRVYDLTERVLPAAVLDLPTPEPAEAHRQLILLAARAHGVATAGDLCDYFRLRGEDGPAAVRSLVADGSLVPVQVPGWRDAAYLHPQAALPRRVRASALLSPFDPLVWERARTSRLFGFDYRLEIYTPAAKRLYGYYVLPFLHDGALRARVDLKSDRKAGVLRVLAAWLEPGSDEGDVAAALAVELRRAAAWQGLDDVLVEPRGTMASGLTAALAA